MSKSKRNTIEIGMDADQTAALVKKAVTDSDRHITYDPAKRPEVANLVLLVALCQGRDPSQVADEIGDGGAGALKRLATEAINEKFAPIRAQRSKLLEAPDHLREVLLQGNQRANQQAEETLAQVRQAMQMLY